MDVIKTVQNLQQKPEYVRRRFFIGVVTMIMILIIGLWLIIVRDRIRNDSTQPYISTISTDTTEPPFTLLKNTFAESFSGLQKLFE